MKEFVRGATSDVDAITDLVAAAYGKWIPVIGRLPLPMTVDYGEAITRNRFDLLKEGELLCGLIETEMRGDYLWIANVAVAPAMQGRGIGRRLMQRAEDIARAAKLGKIELFTNAAYTVNIALCERLGYVETARKDFPLGVAVYMAKMLS